MALTLYAHQSEGVAALCANPRYYLAWGMGTGKTLTVLSALNQLGGRTVVCAPKSVVNAAWGNDAKHFPTLRLRTLVGESRPSRLAAIAAGDWDILVLNYEVFRVHWRDLALAGATRLVCDEASKCKNIKSQTTRACIDFSDRVQSVWMLSGTPAPNGPEEWIPQMRIISPRVFGASYWAAIGRYFFPVRRKLRDGRQIVERYVPNVLREPEYQTRLKEWSWSLRKEDCLTLPSKTDQFIEVELSAPERRAYLSAEKDFILLHESGEPSRIKAEAALIKLRQIVGGSVMVEGLPTGVGDAKLSALAETLDAIGPDEPVVIWAEFRDEIRRIESLIRERGESVARIDGETSHAAGETVAAFQAGRVKRIICHPQSAGHGITLTAASYAIYYALSFSLEQHEQSRDRIHRVGQSRPCTYVYLLAADTVDHAMLGVLKKKRSISDAMASMLKRRTGKTKGDSVPCAPLTT